MAFSQQFGEYRGGGHGERAAEYECALPRCAEQQRDRKHHQQGEENLRGTESQYHPAHRLQLGQTEFQPDTEHQEHHADFGELMHLFGFFNPPERVRSDGGADDKIAQQRRQFEFAEHHHHEHGSGQQHQNSLQSGRHQFDWV